MDGDIIAAAQEERFTRKKHDAGFPFHAIEYCLAEAGISLTEVAYIAFYDKPLANSRAYWKPIVHSHQKVFARLWQPCQYGLMTNFF